MLGMLCHAMSVIEQYIPDHLSFPAVPATRPRASSYLRLSF